MDQRLRGREDASDVLQDVYLDAHQRIRHFFARPGQSFYVWLRQLAVQRLIDIHRRHLKAGKRNVRQEVSLDRNLVASNSAIMAPQLAAQFASPSQLLMRAEAIAQIERALQGMDDVDREILAMRHFELLKNNEVAEVLGIGKAAASNRYIRALSRLREVLQELPGFFDEI